MRVHTSCCITSPQNSEKKEGGGGSFTLTTLIAAGEALSPQVIKTPNNRSFFSKSEDAHLVPKHSLLRRVERLVAPNGDATINALQGVSTRYTTFAVPCFSHDLGLSIFVSKLFNT